MLKKGEKIYMTTYIQRQRRRKLKERRRQMRKQRMLGLLAIATGIAALIIFGAIDVTAVALLLGMPLLISKTYFLED